MYTGGRLAPSTVGEVSAWCPKGDWQDINPLFPEFSPLEESSYLRCTIKETGFENRNGDVSPGEGNTNTANTTTTTTATTATTTTNTTVYTHAATETPSTNVETSTKDITNTENPTTLAPETSDEFCHFPFKLRNKTHWDCVEDDSGRGLVCNTNHQEEEDIGQVGSGGGVDEESASEILNFDDTSTFQLCGRCSEPCGGMSKYSYTGFPLNNHAGSNKYVGVPSWSDCQKLCQQLNGCKFFNYDASNKECSLMYGVGGKKEGTQDNIFLGPKYCPGKDYWYI